MVKPNGYVLISSLICLFLCLQLCSLCCAFVLSKSQLAMAQAQSTIDLSIYSHARAMAAQSAYQTRCGISPVASEQDEVQRTETIDGISVTFTDKDSVIEAVYHKDNKSICLKMFYTEKGVVNIRWDTEDESDSTQ